MFNLVSSYRTYLHHESKDDSHPFIAKWVQNYMEHKGEMVLTQEIMEPNNFYDLLGFGRENDVIKSVVFPEEAI